MKGLDLVLKTFQSNFLVQGKLNGKKYRHSFPEADKLSTAEGDVFTERTDYRTGGSRGHGEGRKCVSVQRKCAGWRQEAAVSMDAFHCKLRMKRLFSSCFLGLSYALTICRFLSGRARRVVKLGQESAQSAVCRAWRLGRSQDVCLSRWSLGPDWTWPT